MKLHFYELHEGATDLLTDALLVSERAYSREEFADLVRAARKAVFETFEEDTLVEAVARELERAHDFTYIGDEKLTASMARGRDRRRNVPRRPVGRVPQHDRGARPVLIAAGPAAAHLATLNRISITSPSRTT